MPVVRDYCCCAIPLYNAGIYVALITNTVLAALVGALAVATPSIVGASTPPFAKWILAIVAFVAAAVQLYGFFGVYSEKAPAFRRYATFNAIITIAVFSVAAVWIGLSGARHNDAEAKCERDFFSNSIQNPDTAGSPLDTSKAGDILCNIFAWVTWGTMLGLWVVLGIFEIYLSFVISGYSAVQREDHASYHTVYSNNDGPGQNDMLLADRVPLQAAVDGHYRSDSNATEKGYSDNPAKLDSYAYQAKPLPYRSKTQDTYSTYNPRQMSGDDAYLSHPSNAYTQDPGPTPTQNYNGYGNSSAYPPALNHPGQ